MLFQNQPLEIGSPTLLPQALLCDFIHMSGELNDPDHTLLFVEGVGVGIWIALQANRM